jgi:hypothetical protein
VHRCKFHLRRRRWRRLRLCDRRCRNRFRFRDLRDWGWGWGWHWLDLMRRSRRSRLDLGRRWNWGSWLNLRWRRNWGRNVPLSSLTRKPVFGITPSGKLSSTHTHVDGGGPFPERSFPFRISFLLGNSWREDILIMLDEIDEEHSWVTILHRYTSLELRTENSWPQPSV